ncbi:hypothetical protein RN87_11530 [Fusobacterium hwasookii ChDC F174]|uniref:Uncharacterized protein n=1 Tax=Fusobacterium hwasookii ChDC F174 TaxID=1307442 RepID=A0A0S2ZR08_9FUSO|nr:hypothetical protein [Fusobacterium hwasookii]ALQ41135.1 hypothetical protein RN87_11530 [Fusobacterium hwasookii ChDC F174]
MRTFIGIVVTFFIFFILIFMTKFVYVVPENHYSILDQTGEVRLEDYPEIKDISFMYNTDLLIEFYSKRDDLKLERINFLFNNDVIGTVEINKNINDLEDFGETYIAENGEKVSIRKIYPLQKEFLRILGRNAELYDSLEDGRFYIDIYIKDLKINKTFVINRNNIFLEFESGGPKVFLQNI